MITIIVPVLNRPHRVRPLIDNIAEATSVPHRVLFVVSPNDAEELREIHAQRVPHICLDRPPGRGDYAAKINLGYRSTSEEFVFTGADDLVFHPGWDLAALSKMEQPSIGVVGTNDLGNPRVIKGQHSTHSLIRRTYADEYGTIDGPGAILCEEYDHSFVDDELVGTARARRAWAFAADSHVEHFHPHLRDGDNRPKAQVDATYRKAFKNVAVDRRLFTRRRNRWLAAGREQARELPIAPFSVCIGTYGDPSWETLANTRAIPSVHRQRRPPAEVIHVHGDDLASARNEAAQRATSPWLLFLDADDELHPQFIGAITRYTNIHPPRLLSPAIQFIVDGKPRPARVFKDRDLYDGNYLPIGTAIPRKLFWDVGGFDPRWEAWEDWAMFWRVVSLGTQVQKVPGAIYKAYWSATGRNNTVPDTEGLRDRIRQDFAAWKSSR